MSLFQNSSPSMYFESSSTFCDSLVEDKPYSSESKIMLPNGTLPKLAEIAETLPDDCEEKVTGWTRNLQDRSGNPCFFTFLDNVLRGMVKYPAPIAERGGSSGLGENLAPLSTYAAQLPKTQTDDFTTLVIEDTGNENSSELSKDLSVPYELISQEKPSSDSKRNESVLHSDSSNLTQSDSIPVDCFNHDLCSGSSPNLDPDFSNSTVSNYIPLDYVDSSSEVDKSTLVSDSSNPMQSNAISTDFLSLELKKTEYNCLGSAVEELNINIKELDSSSSDVNRLEEESYNSDFSNVTDLDTIPIDCLSLHPKYTKSNCFEPAKKNVIKPLSSSPSQFNSVSLDCLRLDHKSTEPDCFDLREKSVCSVPVSKLNIINQNSSNFYECLADDEASSTCLSDCPRDRSPSSDRGDCSSEDLKDDSFCNMYYPKTDDEFETDSSMLTDNPNNIFSSCESPERDVSCGSSEESSNTSRSSPSSSITNKSRSDDSPSSTSINDEASSSGSSSHAFSTTSESNKDGKSTRTYGSDNQSTKTGKSGSKSVTARKFSSLVPSSTEHSPNSDEALLSRSRRSDFSGTNKSNNDLSTCTSGSDDGSGGSSGSSSDAFSTTSESNEDGKSTRTYSSDGRSSRSSRSGSKSVTASKFSSLVASSTEFSPNSDEASLRRSRRNDFLSTSKSNKDGTSTCTSSSDDSRGATSCVIYKRVPPSSASNSNSDEELLFKSSSDESSSAIKCNEDIESEMSNIEHALSYTRIYDGKGVRSSRYYIRVPSLSKSKSNSDEASPCKNKYDKDGPSAHASSSISRKFYNRVPSSSTSKSKSTEELLACVSDGLSSTSMSNKDGTSSSDDESPRTRNAYNSEASSRRCKNRVKLSRRKGSNSDASSNTSKSETSGVSSSRFNTRVPSSTKNESSIEFSSDDVSSSARRSSTSKSKSTEELLACVSDGLSSTRMSNKDGTSSSDDESPRTRNAYNNEASSRRCKNWVKLSRRKGSNSDASSNTSKSETNGVSSSRFNTRVPSSTKNESSIAFSSDDVSSSASRSRSCESSSSTSRSRTCEASSSSSEFVTSEYESLSSDDSESDEDSSRLLKSTSEDSDWETDASAKDESVEYKILISTSEDDGSDCQSPGFVDLEVNSSGKKDVCGKWTYQQTRNTV